MPAIAAKMPPQFHNHGCHPNAPKSAEALLGGDTGGPARQGCVCVTRLVARRLSPPPSSLQTPELYLKQRDSRLDSGADSIAGREACLHTGSAAVGTRNLSPESVPSKQGVCGNNTFTGTVGTGSAPKAEETRSFPFAVTLVTNLDCTVPVAEGALSNGAGHETKFL